MGLPVFRIAAFVKQAQFSFYFRLQSLFFQIPGKVEMVFFKHKKKPNNCERLLKCLKVN